MVVMELLSNSRSLTLTCLYSLSLSLSLSLCASVSLFSSSSAGPHDSAVKELAHGRHRDEWGKVALIKTRLCFNSPLRCLTVILTCGVLQCRRVFWLGQGLKAGQHLSALNTTCYEEVKHLARRAAVALTHINLT